MPSTRRSPSIGRSDATTVKPKKRSHANTLNDLAANEWISETVSVWTQRGLGKGHADTKIEREHPAPFSFQDVGRLIRFFSKRGQTVLDPFVGVGSTLKAAALDGRRGIGIELNARYAKLARQRLQTEVDAKLLEVAPQQIIVGDCRKALHEIPSNSVDLIVTSPPYWNILHKRDHKAEQERVALGLDTQYSEDPRDLGNVQDYEAFVDALGDIFGQCRLALKPRGYMCVVVGDFRHKSRYYVFHADLIKRLESQGFVTKGLHILYQRHKRVFPYGYPCAFVPNLHHQFIVIVQREN